MPHLVDMKLTKKESKEMTAGSELTQPAYPYGLRLELNDESMKKIHIESMPEVGTKVLVHAVAQVERVSENQTQEGKRQDMSLQITELGFEPYKGKKATEKILYGD